MQENPLKALEQLDPGLVKMVGESRQFAFSEGALPRKFKLLIALALQTALLSDAGIKSFAMLALQGGATKEEITEVLRVVHYLNGAPGIYTASSALIDVL